MGVCFTPTYSKDQDKMRVFIPVLFCLIVGTEAWGFGWAKNLFGEREDDLHEHKLPPLRMEEVTRGIICCIGCRFEENVTVNTTENVTENVSVDVEEDCCDECLWGQLPEVHQADDETEQSYIDRLQKKLKERFS